MTVRYEDLAVLRFDGGRFANRALDVDSTQELIAYQKLISECAKELWRRRHPGRVRLPRGYEDGFALVFAEIRQGSVEIPLRRRIDAADDEFPFSQEDEFPQAARLIDDAISAVGMGGTLPSNLPRAVIPLFRDFGKTLAPNESLYIRAAGRGVEAAYTAPVRERLTNWEELTYEDVVDLTGEVSMANVRGGQFTLLLEDGESPSGRFTPEQEAEVLEALRHHREARLRIEGVGEFHLQDRSLKRLVHVDTIEIVPVGRPAYDKSARPIWETVLEIADQAPPGAWDKVPSDLSERVDE